MSTVTKSYKNKRNLFRALSILITILPVLVFTVIGFVEGTITEKVSLGICLFLALLFVLINILFKHHIRSTIWILLIGIYVCVRNITPLLIIMAFSTAIDEFILDPLAKSYANKYKINKEIDKREKPVETKDNK